MTIVFCSTLFLLAWLFMAKSTHHTLTPYLRKNIYSPLNYKFWATQLNIIITALREKVANNVFHQDELMVVPERRNPLTPEYPVFFSYSTSKWTLKGEYGTDNWHFNPIFMMLEIVSRLGAAAMSNQNGITNAVFVLINAVFAAKNYLSPWPKTHAHWKILNRNAFMSLTGCSRSSFKSFYWILFSVIWFS